MSLPGFGGAPSSPFCQSGETKTIPKSIGAWTANWKNLSHNHEVRWPFVFVSGYADGLIVLSDMSTGFWAFRMDGFSGWNGEDWGMPNISSAQDWEHGPVRREASATH